MPQQAFVYRKAAGPETADTQKKVTNDNYW
jgi:hypothetical protein